MTTTVEITPFVNPYTEILQQEQRKMTQKEKEHLFDLRIAYVEREVKKIFTNTVTTDYCRMATGKLMFVFNWNGYGRIRMFFYETSDINMESIVTFIQESMIKAKDTK